MSVTPGATLQRLLAAEFDRRGWPYDIGLARDLVERVERSGRVDPADLAARVSPSYLERNNINRGAMARAIDRAIGERTAASDTGPMNLVINDHSHNLTLGENAAVTGDINVGGTQINVKATASKDELLEAIVALVRGGLSGTLNQDAARDLHDLIAKRDDIGYEDVRAATVTATAAETPDRSRIRELLTQIATGGLGGTLSAGINAGLGEALQQLPM